MDNKTRNKKVMKNLTKKNKLYKIYAYKFYMLIINKMKKTPENLSKNKNVIDGNNETSQKLVENLKGKKIYNYYSLKKWCFEVKAWDDINFSDVVNEERLETMKDYLKLKEGVSLYLCRNKIWPKGAKIIADNIVFANWSTLSLLENNIWDEWAKILAENLELKDWVTLDLRSNQIGDEWAEALMENLELKNGVTLDLRWIEVSDEIKAKLKNREKSYQDKGINCRVRVDVRD